MLDSKEVSSLESYEFIQVDQAVEEDPDLLVVLPKFVEVEMTLLLWLYHVVHLAQQVHEQDRLMVQVL